MEGLGKVPTCKQGHCDDTVPKSRRGVHKEKELAHINGRPYLRFEVAILHPLGLLLLLLRLRAGQLVLARDVHRLQATRACVRACE